MRILIVEDETKIADALKTALQNKSYAVDVAYDGKAGMDFATTQTYDLIVLDRMLPGIEDGIEIAKKVRENGSSTSILFLTAKDSIQNRVEGLDAGADDYLMKPFALAEFLARVRALLRRDPEIVAETLTCEDLVVDTTNFEVSRGGKKIRLSRKEFALLEYLVRNAGKIVSKETIIDHVWSWESDILPNTIEVYIGYLRNKIDRPFPDKKPLINTYRGFGYKLGE
jgi:DNA-binding response OmpR family regulator